MLIALFVIPYMSLTNQNNRENEFAHRFCCDHNNNHRNARIKCLLSKRDTVASCPDRNYLIYSSSWCGSLIQIKVMNTVLIFFMIIRTHLQCLFIYENFRDFLMVIVMLKLVRSLLDLTETPMAQVIRIIQLLLTKYFAEAYIVLLNGNSAANAEDITPSVFSYSNYNIFINNLKYLIKCYIDINKNVQKKYKSK
uniref:Uncharacterized protein n=1 Tax=Rhizophagus irregularis (strain DAOM 181602 / DAOM 197198 / MUCL 43194) TaxID=747089 RepID=U9SXW3_RHIID